MARAFLLVALVAAGLLQGCGREPVHTRVEPPRHSLPDDTPLRPGASAPAPTAAGPTVAPAQTPAPQTAGDASVAPVEPAPSAAPPAAAPPTAALPKVQDPGDAQGAQLLAQRPLLVPVVGIAPSRLSDNYEQSRGSRKHEAIDILAASGTPVVAVDDGRIAKLFTSKAGGLTVYQFDSEGRLAYYYAHLQGYAAGLREGMAVRRGDLVGYVGVSGNANPATPHLHFAVFKLGTPARWWQGDPVNPYPALSRALPAPQVASR